MGKSILVVRAHMMKGARRILARHGLVSEAESVVHDKMADIATCIAERLETRDPAEDGAFYRAVGKNAARDFVRARARWVALDLRKLVERGGVDDTVARAEEERAHRAAWARVEALTRDPLLATLAAFAVAQGVSGQVLAWRLALEAHVDERAFAAHAARIAGLDERSVLRVLFAEECATPEGEDRLVFRIQKARSRLLASFRALPASRAEMKCRSLARREGRSELARSACWKHAFDPARCVAIAGFACGMSMDALARLTGLARADIDATLAQARALSMMGEAA